MCSLLRFYIPHFTFYISPSHFTFHPVMSLARLILIADRFTHADIRARVLEAVEAGVPWVQLRDHEASDAVFEAGVRSIVTAMRRIAPEVLISINGRSEIANQMDLSYHAGRGRLNLAGSKGPAGFSVHDLTEAKQAIERGADYLIYSPIFPTDSKPGHPGAGLAALRSLCRHLPDVPVYALGGITPDRVIECLDAGAQGIAVLSGILHAPRINEATKAYLHPLNRKPNP